MPWNERDLLAQVKALLPEGEAVALREKDLTELLLARLNARLAPQGYVIRATKGRHPRRQVACINEEGRVKPYERFELRQRSSSMRGDTDSQGR